MAPQPTFPSVPPLSPLAEVVLAFEESDRDACALLRPYQDGLTQGQLEVRARRTFPEWTADQRAAVVERALELAELAAAGRPGPGDGSTPQSNSLPTSAAERERRCALLVDALTREPSLRAEEARQLLNAELGITITKGSFYGGYWQRVVAKLPPAIRQLREEMTARRPGNGKLDLSELQRARVRQLVAEIRRDHPEWHAGQIMDEVRRVTLLGFQDPVAFRRNYVDVVEPAPPATEEPASPPVPSSGSAAVLVGEGPLPPSASTPELPPAIVDVVVARPPESGPESPFRSLLAAADPLMPAELSPADGGLLQIRLNLRPTKNAETYRLMSLLYAEMARLAAENAP